MIFTTVGKHIRRKMGTHTVGTSLESILNFLDNFAPRSVAESWDNTGLLVEPYSKTTVGKILLTNDLTEDVVAEALNERANLIISYHPPIFRPLKSITSSTWKERIISACIENKIAIYSPHTAWDSVPGGVNDWLISAFTTKGAEPIVKNEMSSMENVGAGRTCKLKNPITLSVAVDKLKALIKQPHLQLALSRGANLDTVVKSVAVCAGSGSSVLNQHPAELYVTGEMSHHSLLDAVHNGSSVILCNHSNSERGFLEIFGKKLEHEFSDFNIKCIVSVMDKDPLQFV